ncbi:MAG: HPF/RaiA family ribosome-associated protein [Streptosporangiaceae bacterium]
MAIIQDLEVRTEAHGDVPHAARELAATRIGKLLGHAPEPVLSARVTLIMAADPAVARPAIAKATVDINGRVLRAVAAGATMREAIGHLADRLRIQLDRAARNWAALRGTIAVPQEGEWRHGTPAAAVLRQQPEPDPDQPAIRRHSYASAPMTAADAAAELDLLDYDFHLFTEARTGQDAVIYRAAGGCRLALADPGRGGPGHGGPGPLPDGITLTPHPAPPLTTAEAMIRLESLGQPFTFFVDAASGRGNLAYHRYDGSVGLIVPADSLIAPADGPAG